MTKRQQFYNAGLGMNPDRNNTRFLFMMVVEIISAWQR